MRESGIPGISGNSALLIPAAGVPVWNSGIPGIIVISDMSE